MLHTERYNQFKSSNSKPPKEDEIEPKIIPAGRSSALSKQNTDDEDLHRGLKRNFTDKDLLHHDFYS